MFYPCTACHPTRAGVEYPNGFTGHKIVLGEHAWLGVGDAACVVCHDAATSDPGKLKLLDGSLVDITGDIAGVCYRCHSAVYKEFRAGIHGHGEAKCTASGCHDPHTPGYISADALPPITGVGFTAKVLPEQGTFTPLTGPPPTPATENPRWLAMLAAVGLAYAGGATVILVRGRSKR